MSDIVLILALLYFNRGSIEGRTRFQKMVCLSKFLYGIPFSFRFRMYFYGPYSEKLADALQLLKTVGLIKENKFRIAYNAVQYNYELADIARNFLEKHFLAIDKNKQLIEKIESITQELHDYPTSFLVSISKKLLLKPEQSFYFFSSNRKYTGESAASPEEFTEKIKTISRDSLEFHFYRGDFEKWIREILGDEQLSAEITELRKQNLVEDALRNQLSNTISTRRAHLRKKIRECIINA